MTYIYDVLLNFNDDDRLIEFYEWEENDILEHIKKMPLIRISSNQLDDILNYQIEVSKEFLTSIKNSTISYRRHKDLKYAILISDLNKAIALEFNYQGISISKSSLLLDEEEDIIDECSDLKEEIIPYKKIKKYTNNDFLTRQELKKKRYLLQEINYLYENKDVEKLNYLYEEFYNRDNLSISEKYLRLKNDLENNYSIKHNTLYDIVRLTYIKE